MSSTNVRLVLVTAPNKEIGGKLSEHLVAEKLAACVNIISGVSSIFHWNGSVEREEEVLLLIKTSTDKYAELEKAVVDNHPYDTPEVLAFDASAGSRAYLDWVCKEVSFADKTD